MLRTRIVLAAAAIALFALAYWLGRESGSPKSEALASGSTQAEESKANDESMAAIESDGAATTDRATVSTVKQSTPRSSAAVAPQNLPLPALDVPLATIIDDLRKRANAGEARAACRLAAELRKCETVDVQLAFAERVNRDPNQLGSGPGYRGEITPEQRQRMERFADQQYQQALETAEHCAGVPQISPSEQFRYWRQAARQGHIPSMSFYSSGHTFRLRNSLSQLEDLGVYREEAESLAVQAALAGDIDATLALITAYAPQNDQMQPSLLAQATGTRIVDELSMLLLAQRRGMANATSFRRGPMFTWDAQTVEAAIATTRARAAPDEILRAEQLAAARASAHPIATNIPDYPRARPSPDSDNQLRNLCDTDAFTTVAPPRASG